MFLCHPNIKPRGGDCYYRIWKVWASSSSWYVFLDNWASFQLPPGPYYTPLYNICGLFRGDQVPCHCHQGPTDSPAGQRMIGHFPHVRKGRGSFSPGSSDIYWVQKLTDERPMMTLWLDGKQFQGLLDTGANATVLSSKPWPPA